MMTSQQNPHFAGPIAVFNQARKDVWRLWRIWLLLYGCNLAAGVILVAPLAAVFASRLNHSLRSEQMLVHADISWFVETVRTSTLSPALLSPVFLSIAAVYLLVSTAFSGGAIGVILQPKRSFFGESARYLPRLFRLLLWSAPFYGFVLVINNVLARIAGHFNEESMQAGPWIILSWVQMGFVLFLLAMVNLVFDWAKLLMIAEQRRGAFWAAIDAIRFVSYSPGTTIGVFFIGQFLGLVFLLIYHGLSEVTPQVSAMSLLFLFLLRQAYMLARFWVRLLVWDANGTYYRMLVPKRLAPRPAEVTDYPSLSSTIVAPVPPSEGEAG